MTAHGEERNRRIEHRTATQTFELDDGARVELQYTAEEISVTERWCGTCETWRRVEGVIGVLLGCRSCGRSWLPERPKPL